MTEERIDWNTFWMTMALTVSQRSIDPSTKHGCIIVDSKNRLISMGYNSFPRNCSDKDLPLTRPEKYEAIIHSETNAIINSNSTSTEGATVYVTGHPCGRCFGNMINAGITKIVYGHVGSYCLDKKDIDLIATMNYDPDTLDNKIEIIKYEDIADITQIKGFLKQIEEYVDEKTEQTDVVNG
jgi:dCMP deaminase